MNPLPTASRNVRAMRRGFLIAVAVLGIAAVVFSWVSWQAAERNEAQYLGATAELAGKSLDIHFQHFHLDLKLAAHRLSQAPNDGRRTQALLTEVLEGDPDLVQVAL